MISKDMLRIYCEYTRERAKVYYHRHLLKDGYETSDEFLQKYKFTNVNRRLDRGSKYLIDACLDRTDLLTVDKVLNAFLFRCVNLPEACEAMGFPIVFSKWSLCGLDEAIELSNNESGPSQSNAYFLSSIGMSANKAVKSLFKEAGRHQEAENRLATKASRALFTYSHVSVILNAYVMANKGLHEESISLLQSIPSVGKFISYQVWVDWSYMPESTFDDNEYVVSGPGCDAGIDWMIYGQELIGSNNTPQYKSGIRKEEFLESGVTTYEEFMIWFRDNLPSLTEEAGIDWDPKEFLHFMPAKLQRWGLMEIENSFCEFNKLMKLRNKCRMRVRRYNPTLSTP